MSVAAAEGKGGGALFRRMILDLAVTVVVSAMMVVTAVPAFAREGGGHFVTIPDVSSNGRSIVGGERVAGFGGHGYSPFGCHGPLPD
jgi:hypothetical protein